MIRFALLTALLVAGCQPTSAQVHCGDTTCGTDQYCATNLCVKDERPEVVIDEPRTGSLIAGDTLTLSGFVRDDNGPTTLELSLDEGQTWVKVPKTTEHFTARVALPSLDYRPQGLTLRARDAAKQTAQSRVSITVDNLAPTVTLGAPLEGASLNVAWFAAQPKVSGLAADGAGLASLSVNVGDGEHAVTAVANQFSYDWAANPTDDGVMREVVVTAVDLAGNRTVVRRAVTVDVVPPQLSFTLPAQDAVLGQAFFQGGGRVQGQVSTGAKVTADFGQGPVNPTVTNGTWAMAWAPPTGVDFQAQTLGAIAVDAAGNVTHAVRKVTVDVVAPVLTVVSPMPGARLNAAAFPNGDGVDVRFVVTDGDSVVTVHEGAQVVVGDTVHVVTSPTDNPKTYALTLTAQDRAGNSSQRALAFAVDRLAPSVVARVPASDARNVADTVSVDFSEDVTGAAGLLLTPAVTGAWVGARHYEITGLPTDAVFTSMVGAVVDAFGNPLGATPTVRLHTGPKLPTTGVLMADVMSFKAAVDADGVLTVFTASQTNPAKYRWARVNPKTGVLEDNRPAWGPMVGLNFTELGAYADMEVNADLSARRISAGTSLRPSLILERRAYVRENAGMASSELGMVGVVPMPAFAGEGVSLARVGFLELTGSAVAYSRVGMPAWLGTGLGSPTAMAFASNRWEIIEARNQVFKRRTYSCSKLFANSPVTCGFGEVQQWPDLNAVDQASSAISDACSIYLYNANTSVRRKRVEATCCTSPAPVDLPISEELRVATDRREANTFIAARRMANAEVKLMRLGLDGSCNGAFVDVVGGAVPVPVGAPFEPLSLGGKPALLYVDALNVLKVFVP